jgi:aquaporin Z
MPSSCDTGGRPRIEPECDGAKSPLNAAASLRFHWPEYLMEAGESGLYLFSACAVATLLWHPASPIERHLASELVRRMLMGLAMGASIMAIVLSPWGKQSGAHFNPAVTFTFYRLRKVALWDAVFYGAGQLVGAVAGVALASLVLQGAPAHKAVRYAATLPGIYGDSIYGETIAFVAELAISFILMGAILFASNHEALAPYTHYFAAILVAIYIAFESPLSGMSTNPARTFGPALYAGYWHTLWIYFIGPPLGMLAAAEVFLLASERQGPYCAKLHHHNYKRCIFHHPERSRMKAARW